VLCVTLTSQISLLPHHSEIGNNLRLSSSARPTQVTLAGGVLAENIVWQVAGFLDAKSTSHLEGNFLVKTKATFKKNASVNGNP